MDNQKIKVLIADDEEVLRRMYLTKFQSSGFEAIGAKDGDEAFKLIQENKPDVALLDVIMPQLDGFSVLKKIKEDNVLKNIKVILLTSLAQDSDIEEGKKLGAIDYLVKTSLTPTEVVEKVKKIIQTKS